MNLTRAGGWAAILGAAMAIGANAAVLLAHPAVAEGTISYPLTTRWFAAGQVWFALTQALMALGVAALARSGIAGGSRAAGVFAGLAVTGMVLTVPGELVLIAVAGRDVDSGAAAAASSVFGLGVLLADVGLIGLGVLALRRRRGPVRLAAVALALGSFQLVVVTPVSLSLGFASTASFVVITVADLLAVLLGAALVRQAQNEAPAMRAVVGRYGVTGVGP